MGTMQEDIPTSSSENSPADTSQVRAIALVGVVGPAWQNAALALARPETRLALIHGHDETEPAIETAARTAASGAIALPLLCPVPSDFGRTLDRAIEDLGRLDAVVLIDETPDDWPPVAADRLRRARPMGRLIAARMADTENVRAWVGEIAETAEEQTTSRVRIVGVAAPDAEGLGKTIARAFETIPERGAVLTP